MGKRKERESQIVKEREREREWERVRENVKEEWMMAREKWIKREWE